MFDSNIIEEPIRSGRIPGVSIATYHDGEYRHFCYGKKSEHEDMRADTRFPLGCLLKPFTAVVALELLNQGRVSLDSPIASHFPEFADSAITLRHLLSHTAGYDEPKSRDVRWKLNWEELKEAVTQGSLFDPGSAFSYTQSGYVLAALFLEKVTGQGWSELLNSYVCEPLGLPAFPDDMIHMPSPDDAGLYIYHQPMRRLVPFRLPQDNGLLRFSI